MKSSLAFLLILIAAAAGAQTQTVTAQVVVTASSVAESIESTPASVSVITRDEIERREARDVSDVLREVPGIAVARTGSPGKATTLFVRGGPRPGGIAPPETRTQFSWSLEVTAR